MLHQIERMDLSAQRIPVACRGPDALVCRDDVRIDVEVDFFVRVNNTKEDVTTVAQTIGCNRASEPQVLKDLFQARFCEALATVCREFEFDQLYPDRVTFKQNVLQAVGPELNGYVLDDCAIKSLQRTSGEQFVDQTEPMEP